MVKNIVFDLGNVLVTFNAKDMMLQLFGEVNESLLSFYFNGLWNAYDQGLYTKEEMIDMGIQEYPEFQEEIILFMNRWVEFVCPIKKNVAYIKRLKELGYGVYILSNIPKQDHDYLNSIGFFKDIDGGIYSYQEKLIKPDHRIYQRLLDTYQLEASSCLFLDDREENILAAKEIGMLAYRISSPDVVGQYLKEIIDEM